MTALILPRPALNEGRFASIPVFTDEVLFEACGVRIAFTTREGGVSTGPYDSLNFGSHVDDDLALVEQNRALLMRALAPQVMSAAEAAVGSSSAAGDDGLSGVVVDASCSNDAAGVDASCATGNDGVSGVVDASCADGATSAHDGARDGDDTSVVAAAEGEAETARVLEEVLIVPKQVHGDLALTVETVADVAGVQAQAAEGADAIIVAEKGIGALLCFADCVSVIAVLPTGRFAVIHAGWRGVENEISAKTITLMAEQESAASGIPAHELIAGANIYIGPYIHRECFETSPEIHDQFTTKFGQSCSYDSSHIDLGAALRTQLERVGVDPTRIADMDVCTVCNNDRFFSFRAQDGTAGRHGAFAINLS